MTDGTLDAALQALYRAMLAHDIAALDGLLAAECVYVHSTGLAESKIEFLNGVRDGLYEYERVHPIAERIMRGETMAVVYTQLDFQGGPRGQAHVPVHLITTLVWVRQENGWRLSVRQATRIP